MSRTIWEMPGGIHVLPDHKAESTQTAIRQCSIPSRLFIPLRQHIGQAAEPIVSIGDHVLKGQKIADSDAPLFAPIHASTSGTVSDIGIYPNGQPSNQNELCIVIESDGLDEWIAHNSISDYLSLDRIDLVNRIREAGIAGLGGAGFPTATKLNATVTTHIDTVVINSMECEPYITCDDMLMRERAEEIIEGAKIIQHILGANEILIGLEDNKPEAADTMRKAAEKYQDIQIMVTPTQYPSGAARQTVHLLTGRETPNDGHTVDVGVFCINTGTAAAIYRAIILGEPLVSRITTVAGLGVNSPGNLEVRIGTPIQYLLKECDANFSSLNRVIVGGPMMGFTLNDISAPCTKITNCVIAGTEKDFPPPPPELPCIRCGNCAVVCPVSLLPQQLYFFAKGNELEKAQQYNLADCIECGACSYVCPSTIPLVQYYRYAKTEIAIAQEEAEKAALARTRFEARQARVAKEEAEKEKRKRDRLNSNADVGVEHIKERMVKSITVAEVDPVIALQAAANSAQKKLKSAEAALAKALSLGHTNNEEMQQKVTSLRTKADAAKVALENAKKNAAGE